MSPPLPAIVSSGDLIADRRYAWAEALAASGDHAAATDLVRQALELAPGWAAGWRALGRNLAAAGDHGGACSALRRAIAADPEDVLGASLDLARLDAAAEVAAAPPAFIAALFDAYAPTFDSALVETLDYRAPQLIAERLAELIGDQSGWGRVLDLGCGTGLMAEALLARPEMRVSRIVGVDLSAGMLSEAVGKRLYDDLHQEDLHAALIRLQLEDAPSSDLIVAADVLIYIGDIRAIVAASAVRLAPGGRLAFTVEAAPSGAGDWSLLDSFRFAHTDDYIRRIVAVAGLELEAIDQVTLRLDRGVPVAGRLVVARRPTTAIRTDVFAPFELSGESGLISAEPARLR